MPGTWTEGLDVYWGLIYEQPILPGPDLECSTVWRRCSTDTLTEPNWSESIRLRAATLVGTGSFRLPSRSVVPHRRDTDEILDAEGVVRWFDWALPVESRSAELTLLMRFMQDPFEDEWFLERAATLYPSNCDPVVDRQLILF